MDHQDVDTAVAEMLRVLGPLTAADWTVPAGSLEWTCWQTAAHIGHDLLAYAGQLAAQPADAYLPIDLNVRPTASPAEALEERCGVRSAPEHRTLLGAGLPTGDRCGKVRETEGRDAAPSAGLIGSQSVRTADAVPAATRG